MKCENCKYLRKINEFFIDNICGITNIISPVSCSIINDDDIDDMDICYN